jgi:5'-nucleotidase
MKHKIGFYRGLPVIEGAKKALEDLFARDDLEIFILSKIPAENPHSATEKMLWVREHFPYLGDKIMNFPQILC